MIKPDDNLLDYVDDYVHGLLSPQDAETVQRFCETSRLGQVAFEEAQRRYEALQSLPPSEASEELIRRTARSIEMKATTRAKVRKFFTRTVLLAAAASVLIVGSLNVYYYRMQPSSHDLRLLGQNQLLAGSPAALRLAVFDRSTGRPMGGVPVRLALYNRETREEVPLATATTDDQGAAAPRFQLPDWQAGRYELRVTAQPAGHEESLIEPIDLKRDWRLMVSTDKPVYQPGQTIHLRALALKKPYLKPVAVHEETFTVTDPKGNVIFKQRDVSSRFGIASADCPTAAEIIEGPYKIQCAVGGTTSGTTVTIEKYVLPKFKVTVTLDKPFYAPGEQVAGSVQADYFFGQPVADADVQIEVRGTDVEPYVIATLAKKTNPKGQAEFEFRLPDHFVGREQDGGKARFLLAATVTDTAGQKHSTGTSRVVTAEPIGLEIIPESGSLVRGVPNTIYVLASYADGQPAQVRLVVHGHAEEIETSPLGVASFDLTPATDEVGLTVKATDTEGRVGRKHARLRCGSVDTDFLIRPDKAVYTGGETMKLVAVGGGVEPVFVDLLRDGQTILSQQIEMSGGRGQYEVDLPPDLFGTVEICAYRFRAHGLPVRKSRVVYVQQSRQLAVQATLDQAEYRPGAKAKVTLTLTDPDGKAMPGAIGLKAVDEAVFAVLSQKSGLERTFFLLEQELLEPVYVIYPGWSPELFSELPFVQRNRFQQALFAKTVQQTRGSPAIPPVFLEGDSMPVYEPELKEPWPDDAVTIRTEGPVATDAARSPFTLAATSFPGKVQQVSMTRNAGLRGVRIAWLWLAGALALVGAVTFAVCRPKAFLITIAVAPMLGCLLSLVAAAILWPSIRATFEKGMGELDGGVTAFATAEPPAAEPAAEMRWLAPKSESAAGQLPSPPRVRQWFPETLLWRPELITDDQGQVTLDVELADSITAWRLSASAVSGEGQLGGADFPIKVFQPFFVDLNLPVSLTRNDEVGVPLVVYNYLDKPQTVKLTVKDEAWFRKVESGERRAESQSDAVGRGSPDGAVGRGSPDGAVGRGSPDPAHDRAVGRGSPDPAHDRPQVSSDAPVAPAELTLDLAPGEIRSLSFPIKVLQVGKHQLEVTAVGAGVADAIRREIEVVPDGRAVEQVASGTLSKPFDMTLTVPPEAIEGSVQAIVKLYPSTFSQLVEGLDAIFQMPSGCFEQTSSTTYPNVLALDYLRRTGKSVPEVEARARQYIHLGYQRLISFEVPGGGFDWFGHPPANRTLTAYGLMEFQDMARVYDVDPALIDRTRAWLLAQRKPDGSWPSEMHKLHEGLMDRLDAADLDYAASAYIAWSVFAGGQASASAAPTLDFLLARAPESIDDPYLLAVTANAIEAIDPMNPRLGSYLASLDAMKRISEDHKLGWWEQTAGERTMFYGAGQAGDIETTAMATLALLTSRQYTGTARGALNWLIEHKDPRGTWYSTQATVLSLKALLLGTGAALGGEQERKIDVALGGETVRQVVIPADQSDVMQQFSLSDLLRAGTENRLRLTDCTDTAVGYQMTLRYHVPRPTAQGPEQKEPLSITIQYDRERLRVDESVTAVATVTNNMDQAAPMVILDLPIPGGFAVDPGELDELVGSQLIARYQITPRQAIIYLRQLDPGRSLALRYRLRATMPVKVAVPDGQVYEYYDPSRTSRGGATRLEAVSA